MNRTSIGASACSFYSHCSIRGLKDHKNHQSSGF